MGWIFFLGFLTVVCWVAPPPLLLLPSLMAAVAATSLVHLSTTTAAGSMQISDDIELVIQTHAENPWITSADNDVIRDVLDRFSTTPRNQIWFLILLRGEPVLSDPMEIGGGGGGGSSSGGIPPIPQPQQPSSSSAHDAPSFLDVCAEAAAARLASKSAHTQVHTTRFPLHQATRSNVTRRRRNGGAAAVAAAAAASSSRSENTNTTNAELTQTSAGGGSGSDINNNHPHDDDDRAVAATSSRKKPTMRKVWVHDTILGPFESAQRAEELRDKWMAGKRGLAKKRAAAEEIASEENLLIWRDGTLLVAKARNTGTSTTTVH